MAEPLIHVACPYGLLLERYLDRVLSARIHLEIGLNAGVLSVYPVRSFIETARILGDHGIKARVHAPFTDVSLGALEPRVRAAAVEILKEAVEIAWIFGSSTLVVHTGYDPRHHSGEKERWLSLAREALQGLSSFAAGAGVRLLFENVFEPDPEIHERLFDGADPGAVGACLDLSHAAVFSECGAERWMEAFGPWLGELHLHDSNGIEDQHLGVGLGSLDFRALFEWTGRLGARPVLTVEAHREEEVVPSIRAVEAFVREYWREEA